MLLPREARCNNFFTKVIFNRKDHSDNTTEVVKFCSYRSHGKTKLQKCNQGSLIQQKCKINLAKEINNPLKKNYLNTYRKHSH